MLGTSGIIFTICIILENRTRGANFSNFVWFCFRITFTGTTPTKMQFASTCFFNYWLYHYGYVCNMKKKMWKDLIQHNVSLDICNYAGHAVVHFNTKKKDSKLNRCKTPFPFFIQNHRQPWSVNLKKLMIFRNINNIRSVEHSKTNLRLDS